MTKQQLRTGIGKLVFGEDSTQIAWGNNKTVTNYCLRQADKIIILLKEEGWHNKTVRRKEKVVK